MRNLLAIFAVVCLAGTAYPQTPAIDGDISKAEKKILESYGVAIRHRGPGIYQQDYKDKGGEPWVVNKAGYLKFLTDFETQAEAKKLGLRYMPDRTHATVIRENWNFLDTNLIGDDLKCDDNCMEVGHKSASGLVDYVAKTFPKAGTKEASDFKLRVRATRLAIFDKVNAINAKGVDVRTFHFADDMRDVHGLADLEHIDFFSQETLLKGLIDLEHKINNADEPRSKVTLCTNKLDSSYETCNNWGPSDERDTEALIKTYMSKLKQSSEAHLEEAEPQTVGH